MCKGVCVFHKNIVVLSNTGPDPLKNVYFYFYFFLYF